MSTKGQSVPFPITKGKPCQLKWNHSTVFLTMGTTASCHRVTHDPIVIENGKINFHNIPNKLEARRKMLKGEWPGRGCEHCKTVEDAGGNSDRMTHLNMPGITAPPEVHKDQTAVNVTPTQLEIYFGNTCNLKCLYCNPMFSSTINAENTLHGEFVYGKRYYNIGNHVYIPGKLEYGQELYNTGHSEEGEHPAGHPEFIVEKNKELMTNKLFEWLEDNLIKLNKIIILGGEPFLQKETEKLIALIERKQCPDLTLVVFSNLTVDPIRVQNWLARMWKLVEDKKIENLQVVGSLDCWGPKAEYVRNGLNLKTFIENFEYMLYKTKITLSINSAVTSLTIPSMPELVEKINYWSKTRPVYWSMMKAGDAGRPYLNPQIFGKDIVSLGLSKALETFDTQNDVIKQGYANNLAGIIKECENTEPNPMQMKLLKIYIKELDRRRSTNFEQTFPELAKLLNEV